MVSSSSTKRAAKLAQKGKGKRVRFQGGTLFPIVVLAILVLGLGTIVYARASVPDAGSSPPEIGDHWHMAYGFSLCDQPGTFVQLDGDLEAGERFDDYNRTGVHSHDDGVIHWHPFTSAAVGKRADLGVFLDNYGVELTDDELKFPAEQIGGKEYVEGETTCPDGKDGELSVTVWQNPQDTSSGDRYVSGFDDIKMSKNSLVLTIAFQPRDTDVSKPEPQSSQLEELGALDSQQVPSASTVPGGAAATSPTVATGSTTPGTATGEPSAATTGATPTTAAVAAPATTPPAG